MTGFSSDSLIPTTNILSLNYIREKLWQTIMDGECSSDQKTVKEDREIVSEFIFLSSLQKDKEDQKNFEGKSGDRKWMPLVILSSEK